MFKEARTEKGKRTCSSYKISVIGCSGPVYSTANQLGGDSDLLGIGKSSFCARFMYPDQDEYSQMDKRSIISSVDFASDLINYHHTLWWGTTTIEPDEKTELTFSLLEQTVFVDDSSLKVFDADKNKKEPYEKRCAIEVFKNWRQRKFKGFANLQDDSPEKMPDKFKIDGFLLLIDVSKERHDKQPIEDQLIIVEKILKSMKDIKKTPLVVALTKYDKVDESPRVEDDIVVRVKEFFRRQDIVKKVLKNKEVPLIETSADENVNISDTFYLIASMVDKRRNNKDGKKSVEVKSFRQAREEVLKNGAKINDDFKEFLKENLVQYETTYRELEKKFHPESTAFQNFVTLFGTNMARKVWRERVKDLKNLYHDTIIRGYKHYVDMALAQLIVDSFQAHSQSWEELLDEVKRKNDFDKWFITLPNYDAINGHNGKSGSDGKYWYEDCHVNQTCDIRIPVHVLTDEYAGELFKKDTVQKLRTKISENGRSETSLCPTDHSKSTTSIPNRLGKRGSSPSLHSSSTADKLVSENDLSTDPVASKSENPSVRITPSRWCWNGNGSLKILLLSQRPLDTSQLSEYMGTHVDITPMNCAFSPQLSHLYPPKSPHGIMAVYSDADSLQFCKTWLSQAALSDDGPLRSIPISLLMTSSDLSGVERQQLAIKGSEFFSERILPTILAGFFCSPDSSSKLSLQQKMKEFVHELSNISSVKSAVTKPKVQQVSGDPLVSDNSVVLGVGAAALDYEPIETFQKYLRLQANADGKYGQNWLQIGNVIFEFFTIGSAHEQPDVSNHDGLILCFSKANGLQSCVEFFKLIKSSKPLQLFQGLVSHNDCGLREQAKDKFDDLKYEIITSKEILSATMSHSQKVEAKLERKFENIIIGAKANKSCGKMFDGGDSLRTPDSTLSTIDKNSNYGSSSISVESCDATENVRERALKFEMVSVSSRSKVVVNRNIGRLDRSRLEGIDAKLSDVLVNQKRRVSMPTSIVGEFLSSSMTSSLSSSVTRVSALDSSPSPVARKGMFRRKTGHADQNFENSKGHTKKPKKRKSKAENLDTSTKDSDTESLHEMSTSVGIIINKQSNHDLSNHSMSDAPKNSKARPRFTTPKPIREFLGMEKSAVSGDKFASFQPLYNPMQSCDFSGRYFRRPLGAEGTFDDLTGPSALVPVFLKVIVTAIEDSGLDYEGLYRVPADSKKRMNLLKHFDETFTNAEGFNYDDISLGANTLAGSVSWFLSPKNLPEPIIPDDLQPRLQQAYRPVDSENSEPVSRLREVLLELPVRDQLAHWQTLRFVCEHLHKVSLQSELNKMNSRNLATCLCPTFFPVKDIGDFQASSFTGELIDILVCLIDQHEVIFRDDPARVKLLKQKHLRSK